MEPSYQCPNASGVKYNVDAIKRKLESDDEFAKFFANKVKEAIMGDQTAADCVDSYYQPDDSEMQDLGIPQPKWGVMRKCTESGLLIVIKARRNAFE